MPGHDRGDQEAAFRGDGGGGGGRGYHSYLQVLVNIFCCVNIGRTTHYEINYSNHSLVVVGYLYVGLI